MNGHYKVKTQTGEIKDIYSMSIKRPKDKINLTKVQNMKIGEEYSIHVPAHVAIMSLTGIGIKLDNVMNLVTSIAPSVITDYGEGEDNFFGGNRSGLKGLFVKRGSTVYQYNLNGEQSGNLDATFIFMGYEGYVNRINDFLMPYIDYAGKTVPEEIYVGAVRHQTENDLEYSWVAPIYLTTYIDKQIEFPGQPVDSSAAGYHPNGLDNDFTPTGKVTYLTSLRIQKQDGLTDDYDPVGSLGQFNQIDGGEDYAMLGYALCSYRDELVVCYNPDDLSREIGTLDHDFPITAADVSIVGGEQQPFEMTDIPNTSDRIHEQIFIDHLKVRFEGLPVTIQKTADQKYAIKNNSRNDLYFKQYGSTVLSLTRIRSGRLEIFDYKGGLKKIFVSRYNGSKRDYQIVDLPD